MKRGIISLVVAASSFAGLPHLAVAEDKTAGKAESTTGSATSPTADALWKEIEDAKAPEIDRTKTGDPAYVQKHFAQVRETAKKRSELAKTFVEKYPDDKRKPDALYVRAQSFMQSGERGEEFVKIAHAFVEAAPKDERGVMLLYTAAQMERDEAKQAEQLRAIVAKYPDGKTIDRVKAALRQAEGVGKPFELAFKDAISGKEVSTKDLKGKVIVVDFWATWCGPCVAEMPEMKKLYAEYKDKGVEFIGVSLDAPEEHDGLTKLKEFVAKNEIPWPQYYQGKGWSSDFSKGWGINSIPTLFVVDTEGNLHSTRARGQLNTMIPELLKKAKKEVSLR